MYYDRIKKSDKLKLSDKIKILNFIKIALKRNGIDLLEGGVINFFDRDGTINIKNPELRQAIQEAHNGNIAAGTLTGKLPEELNDTLKGFSFLGAAGGGMIYLPSLEKKIPFVIPTEKIKQVEEIYSEILKKYGIEDDLIQGIHLQYNSYEEETNKGMILLLSDDPIERQDYLKRGTKQTRLLKAKPEERFEKDIVEFTAVEGGEHGKEILEELFKRVNDIEGLKMVPPGAFNDRTGKHTGADITALDKGDVFDIILDAYPDIIPHFMGNSTNDIPAIRAAWKRDDGIVSMVLPENFEHDDTILIAMISHLAKECNKNLVLVNPGPDEEFGSEFATEIINDPAKLGEHLKSNENLQKIEEYVAIYETMNKENKIPQSILETEKKLREEITMPKKVVLMKDDTEEIVSKTTKTRVDNIAEKLRKISDRNKQLKENGKEVG